MILWHFFRWFRHIQEASNAYRVRDPNRRSRYPADPLNGVENSGKTDDHLGLPDVDKKGQPAGRSQSFHESSTSSRELHSDRQPSSPPEERGGDSHAKKAGRCREKQHSIICRHFLHVLLKSAGKLFVLVLQQKILLQGLKFFAACCMIYDFDRKMSTGLVISDLTDWKAERGRPKAFRAKRL